MEDYGYIIELMNKKGFHASYVPAVADALVLAQEMAADAQTVGVGGSTTLVQMGVLDMLVKSGKTVYSAVLEKQKETPDLPGMFRKALLSDCYFTSTNALTKEGDLINIDGTGNRVAAMIFGPKKVCVFCGINKISDTPHTAIARIKTHACPPNAQRLGLETPCAETGKCTNCDSPQRMCNIVTRITHPPRLTPMHVVLIGEELGF